MFDMSCLTSTVYYRMVITILSLLPFPFRPTVPSFVGHSVLKKQEFSELLMCKIIFKLHFIIWQNFISSNSLTSSIMFFFKSDTQKLFPKSSNLFIPQIMYPIFLKANIMSLICLYSRVLL